MPKKERILQQQYTREAPPYFIFFCLLLCTFSFLTTMQTHNAYKEDRVSLIFCWIRYSFMINPTFSSGSTCCGKKSREELSWKKSFSWDVCAHKHTPSLIYCMLAHVHLWFMEKYFAWCTTRFFTHFKKKSCAYWNRLVVFCLVFFLAWW